MKLQVPKEKIDLSDAYVGLNLPELERSIREIAKEFIAGVLEENLRLEVEQAESGEMCVVLWSSLSDGYDTAVAAVPVDELFDEYKKRRNK